MFEAYHPIGSKARLAMALGLYTAQRRGDVLKMGRQHIRECTDERLFAIGVRNDISVRQSKTGTPMLIPIHPDLQTILDATINTGQLTLLTTNKGRAYRPNDFSEQFRKWCDDAGLPPECSFHGCARPPARGMPTRDAPCTRSCRTRGTNPHRWLRTTPRPPTKPSWLVP